jgi:hypothetical protein
MFTASTETRSRQKRVMQAVTTLALPEYPPQNEYNPQHVSNKIQFAHIFPNSQSQGSETQIAQSLACG